MDIDIKIDGIEELVRDVKASGGNATRLVTAALTNAAKQTQSEIRQRAAHRTGTLQRGVLYKIKYPTATVESHEKYGPLLEGGTGIFGPEKREIRPTTAKALAFKVGGSLVFARSVKGMRPRPFFKPGVDAARGYVLGQFDKVTEILVRGLAGRGFR